MLLVMKFGGSLLAGKKGISRVGRLAVRNSKGKSLVVVVSAIGDVTDLLLEAASWAQKGEQQQVSGTLDRLRAVHTEALSQLTRERAGRVGKTIDGLLGGLVEALQGVTLLKELTPRTKDLIVSFGERMSAPIVAASIEDSGRKAKALTGLEAGILTDDSFGEAHPDLESTGRLVKESLSPLLSKNIVPVVTGFIGGTTLKKVTTLGRGGSDFTATILAQALRADEVWIWTDVDGIMTADPRIIPGASVIKELSYAEAEEMAFFGAKNMHPLALGPARLGRIPVRIRNGDKEDSAGTQIHQLERRKAGVAKAVMLVKKVAMLTVSGETLMGRPGTAGRVFQTLGAHGVNILMISQSVSESNISLVVKRDSLQEARGALESALGPSSLALKIEGESDIAVIAAVGAGMKGTPGVAAKVFGAIARRSINVRMIAQGSSELNISFVVKERDAVRAVRALHSDLILAR